MLYIVIPRVSEFGFWILDIDFFWIVGTRNHIPFQFATDCALDLRFLHVSRLKRPF